MSDLTEGRPPAPLPTTGRIVHYKLSQYDAEHITEFRAGPGGRGRGNTVSEGDVLPAVVVRTFGGTAANLHVLLDGTDTYWATSRDHGDEPGRWIWPPRV